MNFRSIILGLFILLLGVTNAPAQIMQIHINDGTESFSLADIDSITFSEEQEGPQAGDERDFQLTEDVTITMIWIPAGEFEMGSPDEEDDRDDYEGPVHVVTFAEGFWLGKYELTQGQWEAVMNDNPSYYNGANRPVERVSWDDIQGFEESLDDAFRLPSESEWEYACRAGTDTRFYWGDDPDYEDADDYAVNINNDPNGTAEVGTKEPNALGLYDMSGNVYEWCEDRWHGNYDGAPEDGSPWLDNPVGSYRVGRGGSWSGNAGYCRSANRGYYDPSGRYGNFGFRLARSL